MSLEVRGVLPVIHTPFLDGGEIDVESLRREVDWAYHTGADGVVAAIVSEVLRLTNDVRAQFTDELV